MLQWIFGSFAGWLLRKQLIILLDLTMFFIRTMKALFRRRSPKRDKPALSEADEVSRVAECKQVVLEFAEAFGYIARTVIDKKELEAKIYTEKVTSEQLDGEIHKRIAEIPGIHLGERPNGDGKPFDVKLPFSMCDRHVYIIGRSGGGKTNLIRSMILQCAYYGRGVGVIAPEAELLKDEILPYIPNNRIDDVIHIDPDDTSSPIGFNPLYIDRGEDRKDGQDNGIDLKVDDCLTVFKRLMGETGARMDEILRQSLYALMQRRGSTLLDLEPLLDRNNSRLRDEIIRTSDDEMTIRFFRDTYPGYPKDAHIPIVTRINRLIHPKPIRSLLCQPDRSFNFRKTMDEGKIVLFNLSDGKLGEETSQLLGELIVSKMQMAAMSRADTPQAERRPFHLYLDEFQTFMGAAASYSKILSRARKYKLCLCIGHQQTGQIPQNLLEEIFGNVSTLIAFNVAHKDATRLSNEYAYEMNGGIEYVDPGEFLRLRQGEAIVKIERNIMPVHVPLLPTTPNPKRVDFIINRSYQNYSHKQSSWYVDIKPPDIKRLPPKKNDDDDPTQVF